MAEEGRRIRSRREYIGSTCKDRSNLRGWEMINLDLESFCEVTKDVIGTLRVLTDRSIQNGQDVLCFVDYALRRMGIDWRDRRMRGHLFMGKKMRVRING